MARIIGCRPSPATVMSAIALFVALGGTSYSAVTKLLPKNSVGSAQVINGSLQKVDLSKKAVAALKGNRGPQGLAGAQGLQGAAGPTGATGPQGAIGSQGPQGATGPIGPSDAYVYRNDAIQALTGSATPNEVAALTLPAGAYVFTAKLLADNDIALAARMDCTLDDPDGNHIDLMKLRLDPTNPPNIEFGDIALAGALTLNAVGTVKVMCQTVESNGGMTVGFRKLVAIKVGTVHS